MGGLRTAAPLRRGAANCSTPGLPAAPSAASRRPERAQNLGRLRSAGLGRRHLLLLLRTGVSGACAGLVWAPGPQPGCAARWGLRGPWGPRSWALAGVQPPPHAAPGPGAPQRPRKPNAGEGGVRVGDERAPVPAPAAATASCPPGRKGGNRSSITAAGRGEAPPPAPPPHGPRTPGEEPPGDSHCGQQRGARGGGGRAPSERCLDREAAAQKGRGIRGGRAGLARAP